MGVVIPSTLILTLHCLAGVQERRNDNTHPKPSKFLLENSLTLTLRRKSCFPKLSIFTLTAAITTSYKQCVEKPTRPPRFCANTNIRASFHQGFSIICQLPYPDDHKTPCRSVSFASFERKFHTRMPNPIQYTKSRTCTSIFTQDMQFNRVEQTVHLACYSEQHSTRILNYTLTPAFSPANASRAHVLYCHASFANSNTDMTQKHTIITTVIFIK